jgi:CrcB protein
MNFTTCLIVMVGGAIGTLARYAVSTVMAPLSRDLPWGTIAINISGSFLIGLIGTLTLGTGKYALPESARLFLMVGFCGGYTTFSAFSLQTLDLLRAGALGRAALNIGLSVLLCIAAVAAGHLLAAHFNGGDRRIAQIAIEEEV